MLSLLVVALLGQAGGAQAAPPPTPHDSEWTGLPGEDTSPSPPPSSEAPAAPAPPEGPRLPMPPTIEEPLSGPSLPLTPRPEKPNLVSLYGAAPLGPWKRAGAVSLGFPLLSARLLMGVLPKLDVGVSYDTLYG